MADCVSLLDEELSSFVFNYLTENSRSPYGEEEVCSDRLDTDFPDFDLSQLDASDFDSVNCLSELHWCNDHSDSSPASMQYSAGDAELFETEEENAALLAALTDSLDGIVEDGVGGLSVFPSLGEDPEEEEEEEEDEEDELLLESEAVQGSLSPETEDPSLLKKLLLSPPNVPVGLDSNRLNSVLSKAQQLKSTRPLLKRDRTCTVERKPRAFRPVGHLCTELHRHLTQEANTEDTPTADTEEEEDEDSDSEDEDREDEEEEESSSSSEVESAMCTTPLEPQFPSEKERHSVVELIRYMHTYCVPSRKQANWDRKEREHVMRKTKPENPAISRIATPSCPKPAAQPTMLSSSSTNKGSKPKIPFVRRRETKAHSLLKELLEAVASFDVSKPYRLHSPPYSYSRTTAARPKAEHKDTSVIEGFQVAAKRPKCPEIDEGSFSVRRSRRLASFPSRFAKRPRSSGHSSEEESSIHHLAMDSPAEDSTEKADSQKSPETPNLCCNDDKRAYLCLPLTPKSTGDPSRPFEQTLCMELCGTAGLTPPTTPPHKPVEEELFKPEGKAELPGKGLCPARTHLRKLPEQTELYAQLQRMGPTGESQIKGAYRDHDYCMLNLGESHKRIAAILPVPVCYTKVQEGEEEMGEKDGAEKTGEKMRQEEMETQQADLSPDLSPRQPVETGQPSPACSPTPEADVEYPDSCQPPSPCHQINLSCESHRDKQSNNTTHGQEDGDKCQVLYIHNLPSSVTQAVLRKRFKAFGDPEDCRVLIEKEERYGVITFRQNQNELSQKHRRHDSGGQYAGSGNRRFSRKRYIDLDEAGPGPVKSKYDALDFDTLLKEAQRSLHR